MQQALLAGGAANQFAVDVQKIRRDCANRLQHQHLQRNPSPQKINRLTKQLLTLKTVS